MRDGSGPVGRAMMDGGMSQLLNTPAVSLLSCHTWSSYDEVSTPSVASYTESARYVITTETRYDFVSIATLNQPGRSSP